MRDTLLLALLALSAACGSRPGGPRPEAADAPSVPAPADEPPVTEAPLTAQDSTARLQAPLRFVAQEGWIEEPPSSAMRAAQYRLPGEAGEASLVVYHFGARTGSLEANLERWAGQFEQPDGGDSAARMQRSERRVGDLDVVVVELAGTYVAETTPGSGERVREEGWRMLAAVVDAPQGPYYAKLVGPEATVAAHSASFDAFLAALR